MHFTIAPAQGYLRAELYGRQTVEETLRFIQAIAAEAQRTSTARLLVSVRNSRPIFKVQQRASRARACALSGTKRARLTG